MLPMAMALFWVWGLFSKLHIRQPVRDLLDAHEARIDAEVMRVWTDPETRDAVRRYVDFEIDIHRGR
jgi:hypothetical protein